MARDRSFIYRGNYDSNPHNQQEEVTGYTVTTTSGKQYTIDSKQADWIKSRYQNDWAGSYGYDDADQQALKAGQMSAKVRNSYGNSPVDQQLAQLGLPSEKNLEKYLESYNQWHTGGMDQYFSQMNLPKNYWTNVKGWYQSDMQNAYENTAEDQQRKARGLMPSKWESKYTDTEIDDQLRARGLPPISEFNTYANRYNNYQGIENFYANVALADTNLRLQGINDDDKEYEIKDPQTGEVIKKGIGKDLYADNFFDELEKTNEDGSYMYAPIRSMFKNGAKPTTSAVTGDYAYDRGAAITAANKEEASDADYASYNAFSFDDYKKHYDDLYNRYFANQTLPGTGQLVSDALAVQEREADEEATRSFYDPAPGDELAFIQQWRKENPTGTSEDMFADMLAHNTPVSTVRRVKREARAKENQKIVSNSENYRDDGWGWSDIAKGYAKATVAAVENKEPEGTFIDAAKAAKNYAPPKAAMRAEKEDEKTSAAIEARKQKELENGPTLKQANDAIEVYEQAEALYAEAMAGKGAPSEDDRAIINKANEYLKSLGFTSIHDARRRRDLLMKNSEETPIDTNDYLSFAGITEDEIPNLTPEYAAQIVEYYMDKNGGANAKNATDAFSYLLSIGVKPEVVNGTAKYLQDRYGNLEGDAYENLEKETTLQQGMESANEFIDSTIKEQGEDEETISATVNAIRDPIAAVIDSGDSIDVDAVLSILDQVSKMSSTNYTAMRNALEDLGFGYGEFDDWAGDITAGWSDADKQKLRYALFDYMSGIEMNEPTAGDKGGYITEKVAGTLGDEWVGDHFVQNKALDKERFDAAVDWAQQQIASGERTEWEAYQVLAAMGFQNEMQTYMGDDWHRAHYIENVLPGLWASAEESERLLYEEMTPEERRAKDTEIWNALSAEEKAAIYDSPYWWEADPSVYRTFGQAFQQQMKMVLPGLATEIVSTPVKILDAVTANITGRPEMWDSTQWLMDLQKGIANYGSVTDNVNGSGIASAAADVVQELGRMTWYGTIGGAIGAGFAGTSAGAAVMAGSASNSAVVKGASKMFMSMVKSSPFVVSAFANNYAEAKDAGAPNNEATWFALITGLSEGILEGFEFDELWGKALGQGNFAKQLALGKHTYMQNLGIVGKALISSMAVSGLGEFTEESIGYVLETFLKMRHSDTWGKGTEWNASDWLQQAMMGFITGALGGGIAAGSSFVKDGVALSKALRDNPSLQAILPDVLAYNGEAETMPKATLDAYRKGGATALSRSAYNQLITEIENNNKGIENYTNTIEAIEAKRQKAIGDAQLEVDKISAKIAPYSTPDASGNIPVLPAEVYDKEFAPLLVKYKAAIDHLDYVTKNEDPEAAKQLKEAKSKLQNALTQKESLAKQEQEHWAALYLMNEHLHDILSDEMLDNLAKAYQNGAQYDPEEAAKQREEKASKLAEAEAAEAIEEAKETAEAPENAAVKARELAYDRVYKDHEAGKAYAEEGGKSDSKLTPVQFAEEERQNFQAKTTARLRRVTLELAGLEAKDGMSAKEIFDEAKKAMTPEAAQKLDMYQKLSKALGLNMVVRDVVAGTSGYVHDGKLYVTLNGKQSMLRVAAHELTHYMKGHASEQYDALRTSLVNEVGQEKFDELLQEKAQEYGLDLNDAKAMVEADDEVCAGLCEKMLENPDALERFVQSDLDAAKTLKQRLAKTLVAIKSAIRSIGTSNAETKADLIKQQDTIEQWYKGLSDAIDNANKAGNTTATTEAETATVTDTTTEAPQVPPAETNPDLFMGEEAARREQLRSDLEALAKKGTRVKGLSYQEVNDVLDRVILGDKSNYNKADYAQIRGMLAQLIPEVQAYVNGDESVDVDALNERVTAALDYMLERYSEGSEDYYGLRDLIPNKIALTEAAYNELRSRDMTLRQASNELTKALGGKFVNFVYKKSPDYNNAMTIDELWTRIVDAYGEPDGYGNIQEDALALIDYANDRNTRSSFDDLYGNQREDMVNTQVGEFLDAVQNMVEGKAAETAALHSIDDDYMPLAEKYDAGVATEEETDRLRNIVAFAASQAGYEREAYHGTRSAPFTVFDRNLSGQNYGGYNAAGGGFDFTDTEDWAKRWGAKANGNGDVRTVHAYLNTGKPFYSYDGAVDPSLEKYLPYTMTETEKENAMKSGAAFHKALEDNGVDFYDVMMREGYGSYSMYDGADNVSVYNPSQIKSADLVTYDDDGNIIPLSERFNPNKTDIRWTVDDDLNDLIQQYGAIEQGREPRARDVVLPKQVDDNRYVSKLTRTVAESPQVTDEYAAEIVQDALKGSTDYTYLRKSNDETMKRARDYIAQKGLTAAQQDFHDRVTAGKLNADTNALGIQLFIEAHERGDVDAQKAILPDLRIASTEEGQAIQIINVLKELKGVGSAWYIESLIDRLNTMYANEIQTGQMDPITVSEEAMQKVRDAKTQAEVDAAEGAVADEIGPQLPLKRDEKLSNWRYLSMLGNPVTHGRNVLGNELMFRMGGMKDIVASGVQRILEKTGITDESDRAHARLSGADKAYWDSFAEQSYQDMKTALQGGGKLGFQSLAQSKKRSFDNKILDTIARGKNPGKISEAKGFKGLWENIKNNGVMGMLEVEDGWGLRKNYKRALMEYMKAQGYSLNNDGEVGKYNADGTFTEISKEQMDKAIEWASGQAWTNTFRGPSQLATELNKISKMNTVSKFVVEGVMPFKKTPINIAKTGAMFSPAGIIVGTTELLTKVKQGKMSAATAIDHLSSGLTGTALMALGVVLAKAGILRGGGEDKKKLETYLEDTGDQTYAFKFGNVSINMSAIAPATIPLFMGVALQEMLSRNGEDEGVDLSTITDVLAGTLNPFMEMSFMSSLNSALKNYNNEGIGGALGSTIMTAAQNYGSQYLPTLGGKVAQFIDPTQRTTKSSATSPVGGNMDYYWRSLVKKVPGAEATLQPDVNIWGQTTTKDSFGDWALDFANKFILPTNVKITNRDAVDNELIRVVESTGNVDFLPSDGAKYFKVKGETYKMNASQYTQYSQERGQAAYAALKSTMASASYKNASDEQKADMLKKALDNAYKAVNNTWKEKLGAFD